MSEPKPVLLPCPFCGRASASLKGSWWVVECLHCEALGPAATTRQDAIDAWNRRTTGE